MKQTVYADVLLAVNFFINYFLLLSVGRIMRASFSRTRVCLGAAFGAACSLTLFLPPMSFFIGCVIKLSISSAMVLIAFGAKSVAVFERYLLVTCAVTFGFGGAMLALWLTVAPKGMYYRNGTVYFSLSPTFVILYGHYACGKDLSQNGASFGGMRRRGPLRRRHAFAASDVRHGQSAYGTVFRLAGDRRPKKFFVRDASGRLSGVRWRRIRESHTLFGS